MATIFSSNFSTGPSLSDWTQHAVGAFVNHVGCDGSYALACGLVTSQPLGANKVFPANSLTAGTLRYQMAWFSTPGYASVAYVAYVQTTAVGGVGTANQFYMLLYPDGHFELSSLQTPSISSGPGLAPTDGSWFTIQIGWSIYTVPVAPSPHLANVADITVVVNNSTVWSLPGTFLTPFNYGGVSQTPDNWDRFWVSAPRISDAGITKSVQAIDNLEIDDAVVFPTMSVCNADALSDTSCTTSLAPVISNLTVNCVTNRLTITGTHIHSGALVTLTRDGTPVSFTLISQTLTSMVLELTDPFVSGTYCVTIQNIFPNSPASNTLCTDLECDAPPPAGGCVMDFPTGL